MTDESIDERRERRALVAALFFAVALCPFAGGVRGPLPYAGWVLIPLYAVAFSPRRALSGLDLGLPGGTTRGLLTLAACAAAGALCGLAFLRLEGPFPRLIEFVQLLPWLHRDMVAGRVWLFLALIPAAHVAHELFYRAFVQRRLGARLGAPAGLLIAALLFAWTHVFAFTSGEYVGALLRLRGGLPDPSAAQGALAGVMAFCALESLFSGLLVMRTRSLWSGVAFRAANLLVIALALRSAGRLLP